MYYIVVLAWALKYFFDSFATELPWISCDNWWNTDKCIDVNGKGVNGSEHVANATDSVVEYWE